MIHVSAEGMVTCRTTCSGEAPRTLYVRDEVGVDLAHALEGVEEDDEEDQHRRRAATFGNVPRPKRDDEDRAEHDARDRVDDLDVRAEHVGEEPVLPERDPEHDAGGGAEEEAEHRLLQGDADVVPERAELGAVREQVDRALPDPRGLCRRRTCRPMFMRGEQLPAADDDDGEAQPGAPEPATRGGAWRAAAASSISASVVSSSPPGRLRSSGRSYVMPHLRSARTRAGPRRLQRGPDLVLHLEEARLVADLLHLAARAGQVDVEAGLIEPGPDWS